MNFRRWLVTARLRGVLHAELSQVPEKFLFSGNSFCSAYTQQEKSFFPRTLGDLISSPSNALNWLCDLPQPPFALLWNERLGSVTPEVFPSTILL